MRMEIITTGFLGVETRDPVTAEEMKRIEDQGELIGISKSLMMENAGSCIAHFIFQNSGYLNRDGTSRKVRVLLVAGTGNNGGDAFVTARHLSYWKDNYEISVVVIGSVEDIKAKEAKSNFEILEKLSTISVTLIASESEADSFTGLLKGADVVVVGIFGTGFRGEPRALQRRIIESLNENADISKISVDLPSGLEADSGNFKVAVRSDFTITMHAPKVGMLVNEATRNLCGRILVANIGVPR